MLFMYNDEEGYNLALAAIKEIGVDYEADDDDMSIQTDDLSGEEIDTMNLARSPIRFRVNQVYRQLVDETENMSTVIRRERSDLLSNFLLTFEYLLGNIDENPVPGWFDAV